MDHDTLVFNGPTDHERCRQIQNVNEQNQNLTDVSRQQDKRTKKFN